MIEANRAYLSKNGFDGILRYSGIYPNFLKHVAITPEAIGKLKQFIHVCSHEVSEDFYFWDLDGHVSR